MYNISIMVVKSPKSTKTSSKAKSSRLSTRATSSKSITKKSPRRAKSPSIIVKALADPKTRAKIARKKQKRAPLTWRESLFLSLIGICILMVGLSFLVQSSFHPAQDAETELSRLADSYYIEYLYPSILGSKRDDPESVLAVYAEAGLPNVLLRQLLTYNNNSHADSARFFSNTYYECDTSNSRVRFYPVAPYGPRDYTVKTFLSCEELARN